MASGEKTAADLFDEDELPPSLAESGVECNTIEAPGIIKDDQGHTWAIPAEGLDDVGSDADLEPFGKLNLDPRFHYQMEREDRVQQKMTQGFVPVTCEEVGVPPPVESSYGQPVSRVLHKMDTVLMKIPKVLADRLQARKARVAREIVDATEPSPDMLRRAGKGKSKFKTNKELTEAAEAAGFSMSVERKSRRTARLVD